MHVQDKNQILIPIEMKHIDNVFKFVGNSCIIVYTYNSIVIYCPFNGEH